jgi:hypothetical protein
MRRVIVIPRFKGGSFEFIAITLCRFLNDNGYNCDVKYLDDKILLKRSDVIIFVGNINDSSVIRATIMSLFSKIKLFYAVTEGPYYGYLKGLSKIFVIAVPSRYVKKELEDSGLEVKRVIPHGIDVEEYKLNFMKYEELAGEVRRVHNLKEKGYVLLLSVISEDIPRKGLKYLLDAIRITRTLNPFKLVIRGNVSCPTDLNDKVIVLRRI